MNNKVFQHSLHRELWQWLGDNPEKDKEDWVRWDFNGGDVERIPDQCFACEYVKGDEGCIDECPVIWSCRTCSFSEYGLWKDAESDEERIRLAYAIRDLPVKDGVVCE